MTRAARRWSLADRRRVSRQAINAIETERYDPSLPLAFTIANVFGRTIEEIFLPDRADETNDPARCRSAEWQSRSAPLTCDRPGWSDRPIDSLRLSPMRCPSDDPAVAAATAH